MAKRLRVAFVLMAGGFVVASGLVGLLAGDVAATLAGIGFAGVSSALGVLLADLAGAMPRPLRRSTRRALAGVSFAAMVVAAALLIVALALSDPTVPLLLMLPLPMVAWVLSFVAVLR
jgi:hypothetical protein